MIKYRRTYIGTPLITHYERIVLLEVPLNQYKGYTMQTARRNFLKYASIVGITSLTGISLYAKNPDHQFQADEIGSTHMDEHFDPDSWL